MTLRIGLGAVLLFAFAADANAPPRPEFVLQDVLKRPEPFAESRLQINPPSFRWPMVETARSYRIELSRTPSFGDARQATTADLFYRPIAPLASGKWYWRFRVESPAAGAWSSPNEFTITDDLARWPVPEWQLLLGRVPRSHPRIYLRADEVPGLREKARKLGVGLAHWEQKVRQSAREPFSLQKYQEQVPALSDHRFTPQQVKKKLTWAAKAAGVDAAAPIGDLAWIWLATGDKWFLDAARHRALLVAGLDPQGFISERNSDFGNAAIVQGLGIAYDLMYDQLSAQERSAIRQAIVERAQPIFKNMRTTSQRLMKAHNWQHIFLDGLTGALAVYGEEPIAAGWVELGLKSFVAFFPWYGGNDGGSEEGTKYFYGPELIGSLDVRDVFHTAFSLDLENGNPWFRNNPYYLIYSYPPGSIKAKLGDSTPGSGDDGDEDEGNVPGGKGRLVAERQAMLYGNGFAAAYAAQLPEDDRGYSVSEYLRWSPVATLPARSLAELPAARCFSDIGTVFTHSNYGRREDNVRLIFHSSPYGAFGHAHADQNSFHVIAYDEELLLDSGYYTPVGDPHRELWSLQTKAHNSLLVDGEGQPYGDTSGYGRISHFEQNENWVYMVGSAATAYPEAHLETFDRHIVWLKGRRVQTYVVIDDVQGAGTAEHRFDWLLHAASRMEVEPSRQVVTVRGQKGEALVSFLEPRKMEFHQDDKFDAPAVYWRHEKNYPLPNQWHLMATPPRSRQEHFVTVIQVSRPGVPKPALRPVDGGIEVDGWRVTRDTASGVLRIVRR